MKSQTKKLPCLAMAIGGFLGFAHSAQAGEWCTVTGFGVTENSGNATIHGTLTGPSGTAYKEWVMLDRTESPEIVKKRIALALGAALAGKDLLIYVADGYTCVNVPYWQNNVIVHVRVP